MTGQAEQQDSRPAKHLAAWIGVAALTLVAGASRAETQGAQEAHGEEGGERAPLGGYAATIEGVLAPAAVAIDASGRTYVVESGAHRVNVFDRAGESLRTFGERGSSDGQLLSPAGIAVADDGTVYVADSGNHRIAVFDAEGRASGHQGTLGSALGQLHTPSGLAVFGSTIAVCELGNRRVQLFEAEGGSLRTQRLVGAERDAAAALERPVDVTFDDAGQLYVLDAGLDQVRVFAPDGRALRSFGDWGFFPGLLAEPTGIDHHDGRLFVADGENHRVQVFDLQGELLNKWGLHAIRPREGAGKLHYPTHLAVAPDGSFLAVAETMDDRVQVFNRSFERDPDEALRIGIGQPSPHYGMHASVDDRWMVIVEPETHSIRVFDLQWEEPRLISTVGGFGERMGLFRQPSGVHLDARRRALLVCDRGNGRLQLARLSLDPQDVKYDPFMATWVKMLDFERLGRDLGDVQLEWTVDPLAVTRGPEGRVYVLDARNERILVLDPELRYERSFGGHGTAPGRFRNPTNLAIARDGTLYIVDTGNRRIQTLSASGEPLSTFGEDPGVALEQPFGIAVDEGGAIFASDVATSRILTFDPQGQLIRSLGHAGLGRLEFYKPRSLGIDYNGNLIVLDHGNHRGQVLGPEGEYVVAFGSRLYTRPARLPHMSELQEEEATE